MARPAWYGTLMIKLPSGLYSLLKVGALTFAGAFLAALSLTTIPTTLDGWKALLLPALGAAVAAEIVFLRTTITGVLTGANPVTVPTLQVHGGAAVPLVAVVEPTRTAGFRWSAHDDDTQPVRVPSVRPSAPPKAGPR